jgi:DNA-binding CsgD family transcriptional regulator
LEDAAVWALVAERYDLPDGDAARLTAYLQGRADGNALFLGELLRALEEAGTLRHENGSWRLDSLTRVSVPPLLRQVIDGRIARLDRESQRLLAIAAVIGQEVSLAVLGTLADLDEEELLGITERATEARLLIETPDGLHVRFAHALIREAIYEGISPARRRLLHRRIAELLAEQLQPDLDAIAIHFERSSDRRAVEWLIRAGERAQLSFARLTAAERYEAALGLLEADNGDLGERGWLHYRIARVRRAFAPRQAIEYLDEALRLADATGDRALGAASRYSRGLCRLYESDDYGNTDIMAEMVAGCDALEALSPDEQERLGLGPDERGLPTITNVRGFLVAVLAGSGRVAEALALGEAARDGKPRRTPLGDMAWENYGDRDSGLGTAYALAGRPAEARVACERARACSRELGNYTIGSTIAMELLTVWLPYYADQPDELTQLANESEDAYRRLVSASYDRLAHLPLLALAGRWAEAREGAETALQRAWGQRAFRGVAVVVLSNLNRAQGEMDAAWAHIRAMLPSGPQTPAGVLMWFIGPPLLRVATSLALDAGDLPTAKGWLEAHDRWLTWSGAVLGQSEGQGLWAHYHRQSGNKAEAYEHARRAFAHATEPRQPLALLAAHRLLGELATDAGRFDDAARHLDESLAVADACAAPYERALTLLAMAELSLAMGKSTEAATLLDEMRAICTPLGAQPALACADALAVRLDARRDAAPAYPAGLSAREVEVLRLVAAGRTNRDIGDALFLSEHTVRVHVRNILTKTDTDNRTAAAAFARQHRLA